jgi:RNA polymerase sigma-70 factor (ECF subfamily)
MRDHFISRPVIEFLMDTFAASRLATHSTEDRERSSTPPTPLASTVLQAEASDEDLMGLLCEAGGEALSILFRRYARVIRSVAYRAVHDTAEADDLVQDVFLLIQRTSKSFDRSKGAARNWILEIAHRCAISRHRYLRFRHFYNQVDVDDMAIDVGDLEAVTTRTGNPLEEMFGEASLQRAFGELSINQRETLRLHFFEDYSLAEISEKLGQSRENIKHHYFRGLERLRKYLLSSKSRYERTHL